VVLLLLFPFLPAGTDVGGFFPEAAAAPLAALVPPAPPPPYAGAPSPLFSPSC